jgi:hypothetical protein
MQFSEQVSDRHNNREKFSAWWLLHGGKLGDAENFFIAQKLVESEL